MTIPPVGTPPDTPPPLPEKEDVPPVLDERPQDNAPPPENNAPPTEDNALPPEDNAPPPQDDVPPPHDSVPPPQDDTRHPSSPPEGGAAPPASPAPTETVWSRPAVLPRVVPREAFKRRHKTSDAPKKPGKRSWVYGTKLMFFERFKDAFVLASEAKTTGDLYTKLAKLYTLKYGFELQDDEDFETDIEDPPEYMADIVESGLSPEEGVVQSEYHEKLRGVSNN